MSQDTETSRRDYRGPYKQKHKVPTVQKYREYKANQKDNLDENNFTTDGAPNFSSEGSDDDSDGLSDDAKNDNNEVQQHDQVDTTEEHPVDVKKRRKQLKKRNNDRVERQVTDPVTHLPVTIRDYTDQDFEELDEKDEKKAGAQNSRRAQPSPLGSSGLSEHDAQITKHNGMESLFPPPNFMDARQDLEEEWRKAIIFAVVCIVVVCALSLAISTTFLGHIGALIFVCTIGAGLCVALTMGLQSWIQKKVQSMWEDEVWQAERLQAHKRLHEEKPESTAWFNKLLGSIWPLINPEIFASLGDTLEDVMQASLPSMVRMVSIDDLGQGSDSIRILGIRWLPAGAAHKTVSASGKLEGSNKHTNDKVDEEKTGKTDATEQAQSDASTDKRSAQNEDEQVDNGGDDGANVSGGMEAEEGEFMNMEIAFAYRSTHSRRKFTDRAKHAHLYMAFYLPGKIKLPVWVELQGLVGSLRVRLQLSSDPPFVGLATMTFLGQPKVEISCTPLFKRMPNLMDLPLISNFVQSAVNAAMAEYVAPKSYTLDLKAMLAGDDFKKDTSARGILVVKLKRAFDFKASDTSIPLIRKGSSDPYVSVGWAKFGKPLYSTRVLIDEMEPWWQEGTTLLVGPEELDAEENLRIQLWDSDRTSADDDLGRIEIPLKQLMKNDKSNGKLWERTDTFQAMKAGESMPGRLEWSVGYFTKTSLMDYQVAHASGDKNIHTVTQLKEKSYTDSKAKLREAAHSEASELEQLKKEDFEEASIHMISQSPPDSNYPSGIVSIQIHQITSLELERQNRPRDPDESDSEDQEDEGSDHLPDSYCALILNHREVFRTRTKPKNAKPFFNAATERYVPDWRAAEVMIAVRDARVHEDDALLGMVYLPLAKIFRERQTSQFNEFWPLTGGIGYGRVRISVVFRSIQMQAPPRELGWDFGTVEIAPNVSIVGNELQDSLKSDRLKFSTHMARGKMHAVTHHSFSHPHGNGSKDEADDAQWKPKNNRPIRLPVKNRYKQPLIIEFRQHSALKDKTPAFALLWLHAIPDNEEQEIELVVWAGDPKRAKVNCLPGSEMGEKVGMIKIKVTFWRGIGKYHAKYARNGDSIANVVEVLYCAKDQGLLDCLVGDSEWIRKRSAGELATGQEIEQDDSDDDSDDSDYTRDDVTEGSRRRAARQEVGSDSEAAEGVKEVQRRDTENSGGGVMNELKSYMNHHHQLHRKHRGMMQFKAPRTLKWAEHKMENVAHKLGDKLKHREREPDLETEV